MKMAILELEYKNIRKITALKLPFTKADGSVISNNFIMMANGTGKTTTMELIKGLFDGTAAGWTASKVRSFAPTLTEADRGEFSIGWCSRLSTQRIALRRTSPSTASSPDLNWRGNCP